jgi:ABC-type taurine transport system ATPase subunit
MLGISSDSERQRALQLLARSPTGCTETLMLAHGFNTEMLGRLVIDGLAIAQPGTMFSGQRQVAVRWMTITDLGQFVIGDVRQSPAAPPR